MAINFGSPPVIAEPIEIWKYEQRLLAWWTTKVVASPNGAFALQIDVDYTAVWNTQTDDQLINQRLYGKENHIMTHTTTPAYRGLGIKGSINTCKLGKVWAPFKEVQKSVPKLKRRDACGVFVQGASLYWDRHPGTGKGLFNSDLSTPQNLLKIFNDFTLVEALMILLLEDWASPGVKSYQQPYGPEFQVTRPDIIVKGKNSSFAGPDLSRCCGVLGPTDWTLITPEPCCPNPVINQTMCGEYPMRNSWVAKVIPPSKYPQYSC